MNKDYDYLIELGQDYLAHYGVLGMKWGRRKARDYAKGQEYLSKIAAKKGVNSRKYQKMKAIFDKKYDKNSIYRKMSAKQSKALKKNMDSEKFRKKVSRGFGAFGAFQGGLLGSTVSSHPRRKIRNIVGGALGGYAGARASSKFWLGIGKRLVDDDYRARNRLIRSMDKQEKERRKKIKK